MADTYQNFSELDDKETRGRDFRVEQRSTSSPLVVIAPHGGGIEPGTSEIADAIAGEDHSFYSFDGIKSAGNGSLHITSTRFDEPECMALLRASRLVIGIHGEGTRKKEVVFIGGRDEEMMACASPSSEN